MWQACGVGVILAKLVIRVNNARWSSWFVAEEWEMALGVIKIFSQAQHSHSKFWMLGSCVSDPSRSRIWTESSGLGFGCVLIWWGDFFFFVVAPLPHGRRQHNVPLMMGDGDWGVGDYFYRDWDFGISCLSQSQQGRVFLTQKKWLLLPQGLHPR